jgi:hypothetical protein
VETFQNNTKSVKKEPVLETKVEEKVEENPNEITVIDDDFKSEEEGGDRQDIPLFTDLKKEIFD